MKKYLKSLKTILPYRLPLCFLGMVFVGVGISFTAYGGLGYDSFTTFAAGLSLKTGLTIGQCISILQICVMTIVFFVDRKHIALATFLLSLGVGAVTDVSLSLLNQYLPAPQGQFFYSLLLIFVGVVILGTGICTYLSSNLGTGAVDSVPEIIVEKTKIPYAYVRMSMEALYLICGLLLGAPLGITALIGSFCLGPVIQFEKKYVMPYLLTLTKQN